MGRAIVVAVPTRLGARLKLKPGTDVEIRLATANGNEAMIVRRAPIKLKPRAGRKAKRGRTDNGKE